MNAARILGEHRALMADVELASNADAANDSAFAHQCRSIHVRTVRLLRLLDDVDETELLPELAAELDAVRRHVESSLYGMYKTAALALELAGLPKNARARRLQVELAELSRQADRIWGRP